MKAIKIINWSKHQSYKDRRPPWIRFHRSILDDYKYQTMSAEARALLPMLWLLACENQDPRSGLIELEIKEIAFRLRQSIENIEYCLRELQVSDFIECIESVTKPLQKGNQNVTPETETEAETETEYSCSSNKSKLPNCPHKEILKLWSEIMPDKPQPITWDGERPKALAARWKSGFVKNIDGNASYTDLESGLKWWRDFFEWQRHSHWLINEFKGFDIGWLVKLENFNKVRQGNYHS
jgi:hypothetical protein